MNQSTPPLLSPRPGLEKVLPDGGARKRLRRWRAAKDYLAKYCVGTFGVGVIIALALIFVYLFSEVLPMLRPAAMSVQASYEAPGGRNADTLHIAMDRHGKVGVRYTSNRQAVFFNVLDGSESHRVELPLPVGATVSAFGLAEPRTRLAIFGMDNGQALLVRHEFNERFSREGRLYDPSLEFPLGEGDEALLDVVEDGTAIRAISVQRGAGGISVAASLEDGRIRLVQFEETTNFMTGEVSVRRNVYDLPSLPEGAEPRRILLDITMRNMLVGDDLGRLHYYDVSRPAQARLLDSKRVIRRHDAQVESLEYLLGTVSVIVGGSDGSVSQFMLVRDEENVNRITRIREFDGHEAAVVGIAPEYIRKGFATFDDRGSIKLHYSTSSRTLAALDVGDRPLSRVQLGPRANALFAVDNAEQVHLVNVRNPHPEVSVRALWDRVWYEGRSQPEYVWQSSSATDEFEPKFSLVPLTLGTLKAAFYAMLFATPLAILGAVYSAYFMSPKLRQAVKPSIEIMEALPTVILGFLAGLWFAPFVESHLPAVFSILFLMPVALILAGFVWMRLLPKAISNRVCNGWEAAILIPVVILVGWVSVGMSPHLENWFFAGDMRQWLTDVGYTYDQRNALVVGVAMGFAVIPTIYSISEDAVFNVPKHLTQGSLALGATPWQTVTRVVLLTASPGIFSAVMIGFGRAVGETMIVLMATGNSPIMNFNIFEGMRTLSANIAVEMPEAAVGGTHYRILFLAALVLFVLTFFLNTLGELVRQRLRKRYGSL
ncbi:ABC transporter permease subunit [Marinimicrobium sp. ABcell2]|uniref:ABC transporter permease subunit n=1 Tax=Marinimicrobium sp. ABcell2 TaxID=3069751 RepID=UPI0027B1E2AD|nr:ABC transporter permease subunit [Marinimicrobium sp. ABcell2]MDQ2078249.1 ABC transporter permease subunit [Marinimicrobium sp. ABcell2]